MVNIVKLKFAMTVEVSHELADELGKDIAHDLLCENDGSVYIETNVPTEYERFGRQLFSSFRPMSKVTIESGRLATIIQEVMKENEYGY